MYRTIFLLSIFYISSNRRNTSIEYWYFLQTKLRFWHYPESMKFVINFMQEVIFFFVFHHSYRKQLFLSCISDVKCDRKLRYMIQLRVVSFLLYYMGDFKWIFELNILTNIACIKIEIKVRKPATHVVGRYLLLLA